MDEPTSFGVASLGMDGVFTIEVLRGPDERWLLSVESPSWCFDFDLAATRVVAELADFLSSRYGRLEHSELVIGSFGSTAVRLVKDDEFADRFFLRASGSGSLVEFTLCGTAIHEFAAAVTEAAREFEEQSA